MPEAFGVQTQSRYSGIIEPGRRSMFPDGAKEPLERTRRPIERLAKTPLRHHRAHRGGRRSGTERPRRVRNFN
jgi:hypothetical protein